MGYYTRFQLTIKSPKTSTITEESIIKAFREQYEGAGYAFDDNGFTEESCKWYTCESDLKTFSKSYTEHIFDLFGEGEESGDLWHLYVKNGKSQSASVKITFDNYDESKLS